MRQIKFRAWDKTRKTMIPQKDMFSHLHMQLLGFTNSRVEITQFTGEYSGGEYDDTGKEIWEGDIIAIAHDDEDHGYYETFHKVVFEGSFFGIIHGGYAETLSEIRLDKVRVAGNIYEHPHLLNKEQNPETCDATKADKR